MTPPRTNFFKMAAAAILFLKDPSQKLIRSSKIPREELLMQSNQRFIRHRAHKLFRLASWKMAVYGVLHHKCVKKCII